MPRRSSPNPIKTTVPAALDLTEVSNRSPRDGSYPQSADIPSTPKKRLSRAAEGASPDLMAVPETVLYLAYGSNMAAATFLGMRGIRPLSQVNVSVPSLRLTLGLRGVPYREPCFANVAFRDLPERATTNAWKADSEWDGQLMGIVYEVTAKDWRTIMRTEGAGSSYKEIVVPCVPIGSKKSSADKTVTSDDPRPFLARTLYAAQTNDGHTEQLGCLSRLMTITRRPSTPGYAEASGRYLKLLRDGAKEHDLPECYQEYLASLQPYTITHWRQTIGGSIMLALWAPLLLFFLKATSFIADENGRFPGWLAKTVNALFNLMWISYDYIFHPIFGNGERTEPDGLKGVPGNSRRKNGTEKTPLMTNGKTM